VKKTRTTIIIIVNPSNTLRQLKEKIEAREGMQRLEEYMSLYNIISDSNVKRQINLRRITSKRLERC